MVGTRRLAAIMFTDMVGYTTLTQNDERRALTVLHTHNRLLRPIFPRYHGKEIKAIGDSFLVEFESALDATTCAVEIQRFLQEYNAVAGEPDRIRLRIGIHLGDVEHTDGDVLGDAVNIASRIEPLAEAGGVCVSEQVFAQIRNKFPNPLIKLAPRELKNVRFAVDVYKVFLPWEGPERAATATPSLDSSRIAVLPFVNLTPDPADAYFADGMTEELIGAISRIRSLSVISRTSAMKYKGAAKTVKEIGSELAAGTVLEGSVRKVGNTVRISAQLIDVNEDKHLWAENYDRTLEDVFAVQSDVAEHVAEALKSELTQTTRERLERGPTRSSDAYVLYLKGRSGMRSFGVEYPATVRQFELALQKDPDYALAYAALAEFYTYLAGDVLPDREAFATALQYARKAVELDDDLSEAHASLGILVLQSELDLTTAERELRRAIALNPSNSTAHQWFGLCLTLRGRDGEGAAEVRSAEELDPLSPFIKWFSGSVHLQHRNYGEAKQKCFESLALDPRQGHPHVILAYIYGQTSVFDLAVTDGLRALELDPDGPMCLDALGCAYALAGRSDEARRTIDKLEQIARRGLATDFNRARIHLCLGDREQALDLMEKAYEAREASLVLIVRFPPMDSTKSDPRFLSIARKLGIEVAA